MPSWPAVAMTSLISPVEAAICVDMALEDAASASNSASVASTVLRTLVKVDSKSSDALMAVAPSASTGVVTVVVSARPAVVRPLPTASHFLPKSSSDLPAAVQADFAVASS